MEQVKKIVDIRKEESSSLRNFIQEINTSLLFIKSRCAVTKSVARPDVIRKLKKSKARMMTVLKERELTEGDE